MGARACSLAVLLFASVWADEVIVRLETTMADCDDCELIVLSRARIWAMCLTFFGARARAALSFADVAAEATVFTMTLQSFIIGEIEHDENDCTLSSSATASLDFAVNVTGSGALPATIQTDLQTAIDDTSSNGFASTLDIAADAQVVTTLDSVTVTTATAWAATPSPTPRPTPSPTLSPVTPVMDSGSHRASGMVLLATCSAVLAMALM